MNRQQISITENMNRNIYLLLYQILYTINTTTEEDEDHANKGCATFKAIMPNNPF